MAKLKSRFYAGTAGALLGLVFTSSIAANAAIETDPPALYAKMNQAYAEGALHGWSFDQHRYYASVVYAAGRSYSLFRHTDVNYPHLANFTVDVAELLHYDQLNSDDASVWWIREAALYVRDHDTARSASAGELLNRIDDAEENASKAAQIADADATANVASFHGDSGARVQQVIVDLRAAAISGDAGYEKLALARAADPNFPLIHLPTLSAQKIYQIAQFILDDKASDHTDREHAKSVLARRDATPQLQLIGSVNAVHHGLHLSITAPADEYFGRNGISVLGIRNLCLQLTKYLDAGYGVRESGEGETLTEALRELQHTYPHDYELPKLLSLAMTQISRIPDDRSMRNVRELRDLLIYNYPESPEALALVAKEHAETTSSFLPVKNSSILAMPPRAIPDIEQDRHAAQAAQLTGKRESVRP